MKPSNVPVTIIGSSLGVDMASRTETLNADLEIQTVTDAHSEQLHPELQGAADNLAHRVKSAYADELNIGPTEISTHDPVLFTVTKKSCHNLVPKNLLRNTCHQPKCMTQYQYL